MRTLVAPPLLTTEQGQGKHTGVIRACGKGSLSAKGKHMVYVMFRTGCFTQERLAYIFNTNKVSISRIVNGWDPEMAMPSAVEGRKRALTEAQEKARQLIPRVMAICGSHRTLATIQTALYAENVEISRTALRPDRKLLGRHEADQEQVYHIESSKQRMGGSRKRSSSKLH